MLLGSLVRDLMMAGLLTDSLPFFFERFAGEKSAGHDLRLSNAFMIFCVSYHGVLLVMFEGVFTRSHHRDMRT